MTRYPSSLFAETRLSVDAVTFLSRKGLPEESPPFLTFEVPPTEELRPWAELGLPDNVAADLEGHLVIGDDGAGNWICLDENAGGAVVIIDHDLEFQRQPVNRTVQQLAESLRAWRKYLGRPRRLEARLIEIDGTAAEAGSFWQAALDEEYPEREDLPLVERWRTRLLLRVL